MIVKNKNYFYLATKNSSYIFHIMPSGHLEHIHYGENMNIDPESEDIEQELAPLIFNREFVGGNQNTYDKNFQGVALEDMSLEMSAYGKGDIREPFVELSYADGNRTADFLYDSYEIIKGTLPIEGMPASYDDTNAAATLRIILKDIGYNIELELIYTVYPDVDVITRRANMYNKSEATVEIDRLLSTQVDLPEGEYVFTSFNGAWAREMNRRDQLCKAGLHINHSVTGTSSNRANPFVMVSKPDASETYGECYGFNLVYSGNHYEALEVSQYGSSRFINGINPKGFGWKLGPNTTFTTPEAIMTYSKKGHRLLSLNMHHFVREHIVRGTWK